MEKVNSINIYDHYPSGNRYIGFHLNLGANFDLIKIKLNSSVAYRLLNSKGREQYDGSIPKLYSNLIGISEKVILFNQYKVQLIFEISTYTEFASNYVNHPLTKKTYYPDRLADPNDDVFIVSHRNIYKGTPFVGDFMLGCGIDVNKKLSFDIMFGYGLRILKSQQGVVQVSGSKPNAKALLVPVGDTYIVPFHMLNFQLGLSYAFDIHKKKPKTTTL